MTAAMEWTQHPGGPRHRPAPWVGDLITAILIIATAFLPFPGSEFRPGGPTATWLVIASAVALPLRRRWPVQVLAVVLVLYGAVASMGTLSPGLAVAAAVAMFGVANRSTRRQAFLAAAVTLLAVIALSQLAALGGLFEPPVIQFAFMVAFAAAAGDASRSRREYMTAMTERAERAEQTRESEARRRVAEERLRIARDLHDAVAHQISVISLNAGVASSALESRPEKAREALGAIRSASRAVLSEIGNLLEVLRADEHQDNTPVPQPGLDRLDDLLGEFSTVGLSVSTRIDGDLSGVGGTAGLVGYRVIQEGLTNAHKHGAGHRADLLITIGADTMTVMVTNPRLTGEQHPSDGNDSAHGHGLLGVRERVAAARGTVSAGPTSEGWQVTATLPLNPGENS